MNIEKSIQRYRSTILERVGQTLTEEDANYVVDIFTYQLSEILKLKRQLQNTKNTLALKFVDVEEQKRTLISIDKRYLAPFVYSTNVITTNPKLVFNPVSGKAVLHISKSTTTEQKKCYLKLIEKILCSDRFEPFTYKGRIRFNTTTGIYTVFMETVTHTEKRNRLIFTSCGMSFL